jgi:hypothetical protein
VIDNQICRTLLHGDPRLPASDFAAPSDLKEIAADAIRQLDTLGFVGVLELGASAWEGVAQLFGVTLNPITINVTGEQIAPTPVEPGEKFLTAEALDLIAQRSVADVILYEHALTHAGIDTPLHQRLTDSIFSRQLVQAGDLLGRTTGDAVERVPTTE